MNIKETITKCKKWVKGHKNIVIGAGVGLLTVAGLAALTRRNGSANAYPYGDGATPDLGRDCTMKFMVNGTEEVLGEAPCTELFAKEMLEM